MKKISVLVIILSMVISAGCGAAKPSQSNSPPATYGIAASSAPSASESTYNGNAAATSMPNAGAPDYYIPNQEEYLTINENSFVDTANNSMLTFSLKVDTASYRNAIRYINGGNIPPADAVRTEEFINYFNYDGNMPETDGPFSIYTEVGKSIFDSSRYLAFIRVKTKDIDSDSLPHSNLTFLIDSSGSMSSYDKLPLLKSAFSLLTETLTEDDTVSIVTYAGNSSIVLDSISGDRKMEINNAINSLQAGGSTAGGEGILTAYALAEKNFKPSGNNRIILATDGDFNVGVSSTKELERLISNKRESGVYLSVLGFGMGNLKDNIMETLAKNGNGNYSYIDSLSEAKKVLVDELASNLYTIADDVKAQVEFNPTLVSSYRLIGYENRQMDNRDFNNDQKDAGEIGVGTDVVLMFELTLANESSGYKYQNDNQQPDNGEYGDELFEVRIRYKNPGASSSQLITIPVKTEQIFSENSSDFNFASAVAGFAHLLRSSEYTGGVTINRVITQAEDNLGYDENNYRMEFVKIANSYKSITR